MRATPNYVDEDVYKDDGCKRGRENITKRLHRADVGIQAVNTVDFFLEQILEMCKRPQDIDAKNDQHN